MNELGAQVFEQTAGANPQSRGGGTRNDNNLTAHLRTHMTRRQEPYPAFLLNLPAWTTNWFECKHIRVYRTWMIPLSLLHFL